MLVQRCEHFIGFFEKHLKQLVIHPFLISGWRQ